MKILYIVGEITVEAFNNITYIMKSNLMVYANFLNLILPYIMYVVGQYVVYNRGNVGIGGEIFIPLVFVVITYYMKSTANKVGKGITIPVPNKRFTDIDEYGEITIEYHRVQELILYMADLEDWLERKGML